MHQMTRLAAALAVGATLTAAIVTAQTGTASPPLPPFTQRLSVSPDVKIGVLQTTRFICIEVKDPKAYLAKLPAWQRPLKASNATIDFPMIDINFSALTPGLDEVWNYIKTTHPEKIRS